MWRNMNKINGDPNYEVGGTSRSVFLWKKKQTQWSQNFT